MSLNHHFLAKATTDSVLAKFKSGEWKCCGNAGLNFYRVGCESGFPSPDAAFYDNEEELMVCFEFKPPTENKRGILTGLGQSIAYLKSSNISFLVIPKKLENFELGTYMTELYDTLIRDTIPIGLIIYDNDNVGDVQLVHNVAPLAHKKDFTPTGNQRFWAKHQDLPIPLFHLLLHCYYLKKVGVISGDAFSYCWNKYLFPKKAVDDLTPMEVKDTSGVPINTLSDRKKILFGEKKIKKIHTLVGTAKTTAIEKLEKDIDSTFVGDNYYNSIKKNFVTFLKHIGMIDSTGDMTEEGFKLYHLGLTNGPRSRLFEDYFIKTVLTIGHQLELIFDIDILCNEYRGKKDTKEIIKIMHKEYEEKGMIKSNPGRTVGKESTVGFLKYEFILWNSCGLTVKTNGKPGISFNWKKITEICSLPSL